MAATRRRFASDGERRLYPALVKVYGPHSRALSKSFESSPDES
jgi:hypothetical protein